MAPADVVLTGAFCPSLPQPVVSTGRRVGTPRYGPLVLILVRHGETEANARGLLLGRADPPLTTRGRQQAAALSAALATPYRVVCSPLRRARDTAAEFGCDVVVDERWLEMDYGRLDGSEASSVSEEVWRSWRADPEFVPAGGEPLAAVGRRVRAACLELAAEAADRDVIVVSHVSPIKAAIAWALGVADVVAWRMWLDDAAVCRIRTDGPHPMVVAFNQVVAPLPEGR